jgi:hypothetical protein
MRIMRVRFGLRTLAVLVAVLCVALWAIPVIKEWAQWQLIRSSVLDTMSKIAASPDKPAVFAGLAIKNQYCLANVEIKWDTVTDSGNQVTFTPRRDAVFVEVPDKVHGWVRSADEVIELLQRAERPTQSTP